MDEGKGRTGYFGLTPHSGDEAFHELRLAGAEIAGQCEDVAHARLRGEFGARCRPRQW